MTWIHLSYLPFMAISMQTYIYSYIVSKQDDASPSMETRNMCYQEKCTDIIAFAAAEMADVADGVHSSPCPVLSCLAKADPKKSDSCVV